MMAERNGKKLEENFNIDDLLDDWDPQNEAYNSITFNSYNEGPGEHLRLENLPPFSRERKEFCSTCTLVVKNVPVNLSEEGLLNIFSNFGKVIRSTKLKPRPEFPNKTLAFIDYPSIREAQKAIKELHAQPPFFLNVTFSSFKSDKERKRQKEKEEIESVEQKVRNQVMQKAFMEGAGRGKKLPVSSGNGQNMVSSLSTSLQKHRAKTVDVRNMSSPPVLNGHSKELEDEQYMESCTEPNRSSSPEVFPPKASSIYVHRYDDGREVRRIVYTKEAAQRMDKSFFTHSVEKSSSMCLFCNKLARYTCSLCGGYYCSENCQLKDYPKHKEECDANRVCNGEANGQSSRNDNMQPEVIWENLEKIEIKKDVKTEGTISWVEDVHMMYFQRVEDTAEITKMQVLLQRFCKNAGPCFTSTLNEICAAKFPEDGCWYRSEVISIDEDQCKVSFIDYGNSCTVPLSETCRLPPICKSFPVFALPMRIRGIQVSEEELLRSDPLILQEMRNYFCKTKVFAKPVEKVGDVIEVDLFDEIGNDIGDILVGHGFAKKYQKRQVKEKPSIPCLFNQLDHGEVVKLLVYGSGEKGLHCVIGDTDVLEQLSAIEKELMNRGPELIQNSSYRPEKGSFVASKNLCDGQWYRACVIKPEEEGCVIKSVDYGTEAIALNIVPLPEEHYSVPSPFVYLMGQVPEECQKLKSTFPVGQFLEIKILKDCSEVNAEVLGCALKRTAVVGDWNGKANFVTADKNFVKMIQVSSSHSICASAGQAHESNTLSTIPEGSLPPKNSEVVPVFIKSETVFLQEISQQAKCAELVIELSKVSKAFPANHEIYKEDIVCARYVDDSSSLWYRAKVIDISNDTYKVLFVDFGNSATVSRSDLKPLAESYFAVPRFCVEVQLDGIDLITLEIEEVLVSQSPFLIEVVDNRVFPPQVRLFCKKDGKCVNSLFCSKDKAHKRWYANEVPTIAIPLETSVKVKVNFSSPEVIICYLIEGLKATLDFRRSILQYCSSNPALSAYVPDEKEICLAYNKNTSCWHRVAIASKFAEATFQCISTETGEIFEADTSNIRPIPDRFTKYPKQAFSCVLQNLTPSERWPVDAKSCLKRILGDSSTVEAVITYSEENNYHQIQFPSFMDELYTLGFIKFIK